MNHITEALNEQEEQSKLLVKIVPFLAPLKSLVFHGGTILNLFCTDKFKRYSVDLDGIYLPNKDIEHLSKTEIIALINKELSYLRQVLLANKKELGIFNIIHPKNKTTPYIQAKIPFKRNGIIEVKFEVNDNYVGLIKPTVQRRLGKAFREKFNFDCSINSVSDIQLYGGKIGATFGRNTIKDTFDCYHLLNENINFLDYIEGILYNFLAAKKPIASILNVNYNLIPNNIEKQIRGLGATNYSLRKHIETRKRIKAIILGILNQQDMYYILASSLGVIEQTDYKFKNMRAVVRQNEFNRNYSIKNPVQHKNLLDDFLSVFPLKSDEARHLYSQYERYIENKVKNPIENHFRIVPTNTPKL